MKPCENAASAEPATVPQRLVVGVGLDTKVERHPAQYEPDQHECHRQVERRQHHTVRLREGHQQDAGAEHQPGLVGIPERPDGGNHAVLVGIVHQRQQQPHAQVEAVQNDVNQHGHAHQGHEDQRQGLVHHMPSTVPCVTPALRAK
jgi:hypothetical protein